MTPIKIGIIGASGRAIVAKHWHKPDGGESQVVAAADINPKAFEEFKGWNPDAYTTGDYRELLGRDDIDAVAVFTPDPVHEEHAIAALEAGKHLFLEKPMAISTEACDRIMAAWHKAGTRFMMGFNMRYMPVIARAKKLLDDGAIGELKAIWMRHFVGAGSNFYFHDWHATQESSNSLLLQKASHDIDLIHWLGGAYSESVAAFGDRDFFGGDKDNALTCPDCDDKECKDRQAGDNPRQQCAFRKEIDIEDNQVVIMRLANGVKASYSQCHFSPEYLRNYTLIGTEGRLEIEVERNNIWLVKRSSNRVWEKDPVEMIECNEGLEDLSEGHGGADEILAEAFLEMLRNGESPLSDPLSGRMSVAAGCAAAESLRTDNSVRHIGHPQY
ncbi:MAG: Gfo/Idh/MocA family oxidoreductase [Verrucomicrobiota bacterium]